MSESRGWRVLGPWPFVALATLAAVFVLMLVFSRKAPAIAALDPPMAAPGQTVVVTGEYFGRTEREGSLSLAGEIPPPSLIQSWSDQRIVFVVPEDATSGLVTVSNTQGTSRGVLFTNTQSIPTVLQSAGAPGQPLVWIVSPDRAQPGQLVTLTGRGFGAGDQPSRLLVTTANAELTLSPAQTVTWNDHNVVFRVPAGADTQTRVRIHTSRGESVPQGLIVEGPLVLAEPRSLVVDVRWNATLEGPATVWGPVPQDGTGTRWSLVSSDPAPWPEVRPLAFSLTGAGGPKQVTYRLELTTWARRWQGFPAGLVSSTPPADDPGPRAFWKSSQAALKALTAKWGLETPDPWLRVQRIQAGLASWTLVPTPSSAGRTSAQILASTRADSREASTLAAALASFSGVPARVVSGLWLDPQGALVPRFWVEVWVAGADWVPWDVLEGNPGNLDNRHFAFEVSDGGPRRLLPGSRTVGPVAPGTRSLPSVEVTSDVDPLVSWEVTVVKK